MMAFIGRPQLAAALLTSCVVAAPATAAPRSFDIPATTLSSALTIWARQANVQIFFPSEDIQGRRSAAIRGTMSAEAALGRLLAGSGLRIVSNDGRTVVLSSAVSTSTRRNAAPQQNRAMHAPGLQISPEENEVGEPIDVPIVAEIVVSGIRSSLADALEAKRRAPGIIDAISAEDIGKFPDQNLAESLQRIPGVQITRNKGEGARVNVRGLGPNFTRTLYNGRILPSPAGGRNFSFTSLNSDFVSRVEVQKTPTADIIDGGIAAVIDVKVARPLDAVGERTVIGAEALYEANPDKWSPQLSFYTSQKLADDTIGFNFGASYQKRHLVQGGYNGFGLRTQDERPANEVYDFDLDGQYSGSFKFPSTTNTYVESGHFERISFVGGVQVRPSDNVELYSDAFLSTFEDYSLRSQHALRFTAIGGPGAEILASQIDAGNVVSFMDADGIDHRASVSDQRRRDRVLSIAAGGKFDFGRLKVSAEVTLSNSRRITDEMHVNAVARARASYDFRGAYDEIPVITFNRGYDKLNAAQYRLLSIAGHLGSRSREENRDGRIDLDYSFDEGFIHNIKAGAFFGRTVKATKSVQYSISSKIASEVYGFAFDPALEGGTAAAETFLTVVDESRFVGPALGLHLVPDLDKMFGNKSLDDALLIAPTFTQPTNDYSIREIFYAGYGRVDFGTVDGDLTGNVGLRFVRTEQRSSGAAADLTKVILLQGDVSVLVPSATPTSIDSQYDNWLPSLNLRWSPNPKYAVRLALNRSMTRADLGILTPRLTISANLRTIRSGNPLVKPYLADQADLSFEYYLGRTGILSAALFYKDVKNFIVTTQRLETHTLLRELGGTTTIEFRRSQPDNGAKGKVKGIELGAHVPFTFLPEPLDGLGVIANLTLLDVSDVRTVEGGPKIPVAGVSDTSFTVGGYYEKAGFGLRAAYTHRSGYVESPGAEFGDGSYYNPYGQLDVSASYDFSRSVSLVIDAVNVTNNTQSTHNDIGVLRQQMDFGRRVTVGARVKF